MPTLENVEAVWSHCLLFTLLYNLHKEGYTLNVGTLNPLGALSLLVVRIQYFTNFVLNEIEEKHQNILFFERDISNH